MRLFARIVAMIFFLLVAGGICVAADVHAIFKSVDQGRSWIRSDSGIPKGSRVNVFASRPGALFAGTDSGVFISIDEAQTWAAAKGLAASSGRIISLATIGRSVFAGTDKNGILVSSDEGKSWVRNAFLPAKKIRCLLAQGGKLYAGTDTDGVFVSDDKGVAWTNLRQGLPPQAQVFAMAIVEDRLFAGLYSKGLFVWNEQEGHWEKAGNVSPLVLATSRGTLIAGHNPGGLYWSSDLGASWSKGSAEKANSQPELPAEAPVWETAGNDDLVVAGASTGIYYSKDHGRTWTRSRTGLSKHSPGIAFLLARNFTLAATTIDGAGSD